MSTVSAELVRAGDVSELVATGDTEALDEELWMIWLAWCAGTSRHTVLARSADVRKFGRFVYGEDLDGPKAEVPIESARAVYKMLSGGSTRAEAVMSKFMRWLEAQGQRDTTRARAVVTMRTLAEFMRRKNAAPCNLAEVAVPKFDAYENAEGPPLERVKKAIRELSLLRSENPGSDASDLAARDCALILVCLYSLVRKEELRGLRWKDVGSDENGPLIKFVAKGRKNRRSNIGDVALEALQAWHQRLEDRIGTISKTGHIFCSLDGEQISGTRIYQLCVKYVGTGSHGIRHTAATEIGKKNVLAAKEKLGHKHLTTTQVYIDRVASTAAISMEILEDIMDT